MKAKPPGRNGDLTWAWRQRQKQIHAVQKPHRRQIVRASARESMNPAKFDRCVKAVKRSLKKYDRPGNAFAICSQTRTNPARWNPILPLDIWTATMGPQLLGQIESERERIARGLKPRKRRNLFGFKKRVTYHAHIVRPKATSRVMSYEGKAIYRTPEGDYTTSIDRDSRHDTLADAKAFIRSWKTNRGRKRKRKNPGRLNTAEAAEQFYEGFHGEPSKHSVKIETPIHWHKHTGGIGELRKLKIKSANGFWRVTVKFSKPYPILSAAENRKQLFIDGGDQSVNLRDFGIKTPHEKEVLGQVTDVYYFTTKKHLRPEDGGTAIYHHKFGRVKPTIVYDVPNQLMEFAGGGYTIPDEGIDS